MCCVRFSWYGCDCWVGKVLKLGGGLGEVEGRCACSSGVCAFEVSIKVVDV